MSRLDEHLEAKLTALARAMVDQQAARVVVAPQQAKSGFWFGGGNMVDATDGPFYLTGRYRNQGDSRTGLGAGERGLELAIFRSDDRGKSFQKVLSFAKSDLDVGDRRVLSIEGSALHWTRDGVELFVSTEKSGIGYPAEFEAFLKPGTGVWTIERLVADSVEGLKGAVPETVLQSNDPQFLHVKDPTVYERPNGDLVLLFCTHPFCWSSSNSACAIREHGETGFSPPRYDFFPRGFTWDVAITRATAIVDVPRIGAFSDLDVSLIFYDGGEALRNLDEHDQAVPRPRGYSCEEIGGVGYFVDGELNDVRRLSVNLPMFISPWGTGCSRYVDVLAADDGFYVTWQQSQRDLSQPLVMNFVGRGDIESIL